MTSQLIAGAASIALLGAGFAGAEGTRSVEALPAQSAMVAANEVGSGNKCLVEVVRSGTPGAADITRSALADGSCVCTVTTGQPSGNGSAEEIVTNLLRESTCDGAPAPGKVVEEVAAGGGASQALIIGLGTVGLLGATLGLAAGNDSPG
ncbi:MAG: hypothetical protein ABL912_14300 [Novosphingobium sp.]